MTDFLPKDIVDGLEAARMHKLHLKSRLRIHADKEVHPVLRFWDGGFALDARSAPQLRGLVDVYNGSRHISQCLIVASSEDAGEMVYEFKRHTAAVETAPVDFERSEQAPVALVGYDRP